jgi:hypothetical protein
LFPRLLLLAFLAACCGCASHAPALSSAIAEMLPKDSDFRFEVPEGWGHNLLKGALVLETNAGEGKSEVGRIVDGDPASSWTGRGGEKKPWFVFDFGREVEFNTLVVFNRHTDQRGTGGGNNAARELVVSAAEESSPDSFQTVVRATLPGPRAQCVEGDGKHVCFFIDNTDPTIIEVPVVSARLLKVEIASSHWLPAAEKSWPGELSSALSEVMVFLAPPADR